MNNITFKCPYNEISCPYVDITTSTLDQDCSTCKEYIESQNKRVEFVKKFNNQLDISPEFKRFEFYAGTNWSKSYSIVGLIPNVSLIVDNQMNETWSFTNLKGENITVPSAISISLILDWLGFYMEFIFNFKTSKSLKY